MHTKIMIALVTPSHAAINVLSVIFLVRKWNTISTRIARGNMSNAGIPGMGVRKFSGVVIENGIIGI